MTAGQAEQELYERARAQFPVFSKALAHMAFMENAGGSQVSAEIFEQLQEWCLACKSAAMVIYRSQPVLQMLCGSTCFSTMLSSGLDMNCPSDLQQLWRRLMRSSR